MFGYIFISALIKSLILIVFLLVAVAFFTVLERKLIASVQRRRGPYIVGTFRLLQGAADGAKLLIKETVIPSSSNPVIFVLSPIFTFVVALMG